MTPEPPERLNIADWFLDQRVIEGRGGRQAVLTADRTLTYAEVQSLAHRFAHLLTAAGAEPEQRVLIALPDGPEFVGALFGTLELGGVVVMANPGLSEADLAALLEYTRAVVVVTDSNAGVTVRAAAKQSRHVKEVLVIDGTALQQALAAAPSEFETFPSHRDDPAIWLFSGGTTGRPKAVIQTHRSFVNTTECYGRGVIGYREDDLTLSVPKLYFGYATGSNLLFPFSAGGATVLFPEPRTRRSRCSSTSAASARPC